MESLKVLILQALVSDDIDENLFIELNAHLPKDRKIQIILSFLKYKLYKDKNSLSDFIAFFDKKQFEMELQNLNFRANYIEHIKNLSKFRVIDWDDQVVFDEIIRHFYISSLFEMRKYKQLEEIIKKEEAPNEKNKKSIFALQLGMKNEQTNKFFKNSYGPTKTLDEYVDFVESTNKNTLSRLKEKQEREIMYKNLYQISSESTEEMFDVSDDASYFKGNLYKQG